MKGSLKQWIVATLVSSMLGFFVGYGLLWVWSLSRLVLFGYGDSGPSWITTVNDIVFFAGLLGSIAGGQILFFLKRKKGMNND